MKSHIFQNFIFLVIREKDELYLSLESVTSIKKTYKPAKGSLSSSKLFVTSLHFLKKPFSFEWKRKILVLSFCCVASLLLTTFNLENEAFYYVVTAFWHSKYENACKNQVYVAQIVSKNERHWHFKYFLVSIFQYGEGIVMFKPRFFMIIFGFNFHSTWLFF